jgi:lysozyme family protein
MKYIKLADVALYLDRKGFYKKADLITRSLIKLSQEQDQKQDDGLNQDQTNDASEEFLNSPQEEPPFELKEGLETNDPDTVMKYFIGFAFDMLLRDPNISKSKIKLELVKKISEKLEEMSDENKIKYSNLESNVMKELEKQSWFTGLPDINEATDSNDIKFDPNSTGFQNAIKYILDVEGGYSDYNPETGDPRTNLGIIQSEYDEYRAAKGLDNQSVRYITRDEAEEIYFKNYWTKANCEQIYQHLPKTAITIFDFAVNSGLGGASSLVARTLGIGSTRFDSLMVSQIIKQGLEIGDATLMQHLIAKRRINYDEIIKANSKKKDYGPGWNNRLDKLESFNSQ